MPLLIRKLLFVVALGFFTLLVGALLGGTVFRSHSGHGLGGLATLFEGAAIGLLVGLASAVILITRPTPRPWGWLSLGAASGCALIFGLIQILDATGRW